MTDQHLVLQLIAPAPVGGAETVVRSLISSSDDRRYRHYLVALLQGNGKSPYAHQVAAARFPVTEIRCGRRRYGREARAVAKLAPTLGADLIHSHAYHADLVGARAARCAGLPIVATAHGLTGGDWKNRLYQWLDLRALRHFDGVIAVSQPLHDTLIEFGCRPDRVRLIANGFAPGRLLSRAVARQELGLDPTAPVIGWVGRFTEEKDPLAFVDLIHRLAESAVSAIMLGEGPLLKDARRRAEAVGLPHSSCLTPGRVDDAGRYTQAFDLLVMTSRTEGTPMVLLEAMAAHTPIAAYAVGGIPDILDDSCAYLVPASKPDQLVDIVREVLAHPEVAKRRAARARYSRRPFLPWSVAGSSGVRV